MKNKLLLLIYAVIGTITTWIVIDVFLVPMPLWKYLIIETLFVLTKMIYEKEKERLDNKGNAS
jgi:hypothetical protein